MCNTPPPPPLSVRITKVGALDKEKLNASPSRSLAEMGTSRFASSSVDWSPITVKTGGRFGCETVKVPFVTLAIV